MTADATVAHLRRLAIDAAARAGLYLATAKCPCMAALLRDEPQVRAHVLRLMRDAAAARIASSSERGP